MDFLNRDGAAFVGILDAAINRRQSCRVHLDIHVTHISNGSPDQTRKQTSCHLT